MDLDAEAGKRIHLLYSGKECPGATQAEIDRAEKALQVDAKMKSAWLTSIGADLEPAKPILELRESRWWLRGENQEPLYSGQTDAVWIRGDEGGEADILVADLKGLFGYHDPAPLNMQIRRYIALVAANRSGMNYTGIRSASAYLNQPAKTLNPVMTTYDADAIEMAVMEMHMDLAAMMDPDAKRIAGPVQCHHCRAKLLCPEFEKAQSAVMVSVVEQVTAPPSKETLSEGIAALPGPTLAKFLAWVPAFRDACDLAQTEGKRRLRDDPASVPGWALKPNAPRSKVEDVTTLFARCSAEWQVTGLAFTALCSITKKNIQQLVREKSKLKGAALDAKVTEIMAGTTRPIPVSASLEKVK
jgi:hypothetical protein